jgi:hypothetical protein
MYIGREWRANRRGKKNEAKKKRGKKIEVFIFLRQS